MSSPPSTSVVLGRRALLVLTLINMFNYIDRWVVPPLFESLKRDPVLGHPSDARLGSLMTAFVIIYMLASPFFGALGDRMRRTRLIAFGVALWSLATATAGLASSFVMLFAARATVGIGEAAYGTIAPTVLADYYAPDRRGRIMAIFACAIPIGSALGFVLGGLVDTHFGWRMAFFVAGVPGLLLSLLVLTVGDPPRGALDRGAGRRRGCRLGAHVAAPGLRGAAAQPPVRAHLCGLCGLHLCARRHCGVAAVVFRARARRAARAGGHRARSDRRRHRFRRDVCRRMAGRSMAADQSSGVLVGLGHWRAPRRAHRARDVHGRVASDLLVGGGRLPGAHLRLDRAHQRRHGEHRVADDAGDGARGTDPRDPSVWRRAVAAADRSDLGRVFARPRRADRARRRAHWRSLLGVGRPGKCARRARPGAALR